jgi:AraC-like DNA-binding protein
VGFSRSDSGRISATTTTPLAVAALVLDRRDVARLTAALRPSVSAPPSAQLYSFLRIAELDSAMQRIPFDVLVIEPTDVDGRPTAETIRSIRERFPRMPVLGHVLMRPGMSGHILSFARTGVHELIVAGVDDSAQVLRVALRRASRRCLAEEVFEEVQPVLPADAAQFVRYCLENARDALSVTEISTALGVHRRTLVNRMQASRLPPPSELWMWSRVLLAARYLETPGRSVEWVAESVGFPSANALRNALKRYVRLAPGDLRAEGGFARATLAFRAALLSPARTTHQVAVAPGEVVHRRSNLRPEPVGAVRQAAV